MVLRFIHTYMWNTHDCFKKFIIIILHGQSEGSWVKAMLFSGTKGKMWASVQLQIPAHQRNPLQHSRLLSSPFLSQPTALVWVTLPPTVPGNTSGEQVRHHSSGRHTGDVRHSVSQQDSKDFLRGSLRTLRNQTSSTQWIKVFVMKYRQLK